MPDVLVVEAEAPLRLLIAVNLIHRHYQVAELDLCIRVYDQVSIVRPDLIILDVNYRENTVWELLQWLAESEIAVMLTSTLPDNLSKGMGYPCVKALLLKPYSISELLRSLPC